MSRCVELAAMLADAVVQSEHVVERALTIVLRGLRSAARSEQPVPRPALHLPTP